MLQNITKVEMKCMFYFQETQGYKDLWDHRDSEVRKETWENMESKVTEEIEETEAFLDYLDHHQEVQPENHHTSRHLTMPSPVFGQQSWVQFFTTHQ